MFCGALVWIAASACCDPSLWRSICPRKALDLPPLACSLHRHLDSSWQSSIFSRKHLNFGHSKACFGLFFDGSG